MISGIKVRVAALYEKIAFSIVNKLVDNIDQLLCFYCYTDPTTTTITYIDIYMLYRENNVRKINT